MTNPEPLSDEWFHRLTVDDREFSTQVGCKAKMREVAAAALEWAVGMCVASTSTSTAANTIRAKASAVRRGDGTA